MKYKHKPKTNEDAAFSSRISPWLANGSLSVRKVYHETRKFEEKYGVSEETKLFIN